LSAGLEFLAALARNPHSVLSRRVSTWPTARESLLAKANNSSSNTPMKTFAMTLVTAVLLVFSANTFSAQTQTAPKTVIHVVTVKWKADATPKQIQAALDGVKALPAAYLGITRVWIKSIKVQGDKANAFVMEFVDEAALKAYADSAAQKEWYKVYIPIREESTTFDITN
jgi:hypothetical protein